MSICYLYPAFWFSDWQHEFKGDEAYFMQFKIDRSLEKHIHWYIVSLMTVGMEIDV